MTSDKQRELTPLSNKGKRVPLYPKEERADFFLLFGFLLLLAANFPSFINNSAPSYANPEEVQILGRGIAFATLTTISYSILLITGLFTLHVCIVGINSKNYSRLAKTGCSFLIAANFIFIFRNNHSIGISKFFLLCALLLLIPAINERIRQLGSPQSAQRRLCFVYAFIPLCIAAFVAITVTTSDFALFRQLIFVGLGLATLILWMISMNMTTWVNIAIEEGSNDSADKEESSDSTDKDVIYTLSHMGILIVLWLSMLAANFIILFLVILALGGFANYYLIDKPRISRIIHRVGLALISISLIFLIASAPVLIDTKSKSTGMLTLILLITAAFFPLCLAYYRRALLESPNTQNKGWIHFFLLMNFPASIIGATVVFFSILSLLGI